MAAREAVGVIGTGIMGAPMARNLAKAGFDVIAYNRTPARAQALQADGVTVADSVAQVGQQATVVITMVPDTPDVLAVVEGEGGLANAMAEGSVLIDMSTVSPAETRALAERLAARGIAMLDAPVSGGSWGAQQATLTIMAGGAPETFERCLPIFEAMGKSITLMGPSGMGQTTKLVNQVLVAGTCAAVAEALVFAGAQGADLLKTIEAVSGGAAGSWQLANLGPRMAQRDFAPGFMVKLQQKDLRLILEAARETNVPLALTGVARQYLADVEAMGCAEEGTQAIIKAVERLAGAEAGDISRDAQNVMRGKGAGAVVHYAVVLIVFAITGSLTVLLARFLLNNILGLEGSLWSGPWSYRVVYVLLITPVYSVLLISVGTLFGKHTYFRHRVVRIWSHVLPLHYLHARK